MSKPINPERLIQAANSVLSKILVEYPPRRRPTYKMAWEYGKYSIYKTEYSIKFARPHTTTVAKGLDEETAKGYMKLLENQDE